MIKKVLFLVLFNISIGAYACSCNFNLDIKKTIENTPLILTGRVISIDVCELEPGNPIKSIMIKVTEAFKGTKSNIVEIRTALGEKGDCGEKFTKGEEYLIWGYDEFLSEKNDGVYGTSICNWNGLVSEHKAGVEILRQMKSESKL